MLRDYLPPCLHRALTNETQVCYAEGLLTSLFTYGTAKVCNAEGLLKYLPPCLHRALQNIQSRNIISKLNFSVEKGDKAVKEESKTVELSESVVEEIKQSTLAMFEGTVLESSKETSDFSSSNEYLMVTITNMQH